MQGGQLDTNIWQNRPNVREISILIQFLPKMGYNKYHIFIR